MVLSNPEILVVGGKTRIAKALVVECEKIGYPLRIVARTPEEALALGNLYPRLVVLSGWQEPIVGVGSNRETCVIVCALGLVHPRPPTVDADMDQFQRDLSQLRCLFRSSGTRVHAVLVSSVVAHVPPRDRAYYSALKNLAESATASLLRGLPTARLSVIYPGHLVEKRKRSSLGELLATPYPALARELMVIAREDKQVMRVFGIDARLWLLARMSSLFLTATRRNCPAVGWKDRDGLPHT